MTGRARRAPLRGAVAAAAVLAIGPGTASASDIQFGPRLHVSDHADLGVGADVRWTFLPSDRRLALTASFDYFFPDDDRDDLDDALRDISDLFGGALPPVFDLEVEQEYWEANLNLTWDFGRAGTVVPYAGVGVNYAEARTTVLGFESDASDVGANVLTGVRIARRFYVEAKREAGGGELFVLTVGARF